MLANIITETKLDDFDKFFNVKKDLSNIDTNIPTLIVGWGLLKRLYPEKEFSILNKKIDEKLFWTFSRNEKRIEQEADIINFYNLILSNVYKEKKYININIFKQKYSNIKKIINIVKSDKIVYIYIYMDSFMYLYFDDFIIGISLNDIEYLNINTKRIFDIIKCGKNNIMLYNDNFLPLTLKKQLISKKMYIPYFFSLIK